MAAERKPHVVVATRIYTPEAAAAAFRERALVDALGAAGARVTVLTTKVPGHSAMVGDDGGASVSRWPVKRDNLGQVRGYFSYLSFDIPLALRLLFTRRVAAVVVEPPPTTGAVSAVVCALKRVPYVFYAADVWSDASESVGGVPNFVVNTVRWLEVNVWRRAARVLAISPGVAARVRELSGGDANIALVGNGIDTDTFQPAAVAADPPAGPYFVYAGTVSEWQGADVFVDAFRQLQETHPEARLLFFSEGSGRRQLEDRVRREGIAGVEFRGKVSPAEVAGYLSGAVAGLSSIVPGQGYDFALPTKIYAALACDTPVIHYGTGAAQELIADNDLGWACGADVTAVAAAMRQAVSGQRKADAGRLREWTLAHASLAGCAAKAADAVLACLPGHK
ncbi:glycosyltransferase family 4 protein [Dermabacteraceae bacterium P7054]